MKLLTLTILLSITTSSLAEAEPNPLKKILLNKLETKTELHNFNIKSSVKIGVIDTGVSKGFRQKVSINQNEALYKLDSSHGVHVQGIINLLSENKQISHYNFYKSTNPQQQVRDFLDELKTAINNNPRIINLSLGGDIPEIEERILIKKGQRKGIIFVSAAGNEGQDMSKFNYYPASYVKEGNFPNIISVANFINEYSINYSSNYGGKTFIGANGSSIPSYCPNNLAVPCYMTGTSQATPIITSAISLLLERYPYLTMPQIKHILSVNSIKNEMTLSYTEVGYFSWDSFIRWLNKNYSEKDIFPTRADLQKKYEYNPVALNTRN